MRKTNGTLESDSTDHGSCVHALAIEGGRAVAPSGVARETKRFAPGSEGAAAAVAETKQHINIAQEGCSDSSSRDTPIANSVIAAGRHVSVEELDEVNEQLARYMRSYAQLSVGLFGRYPAFLKEEERNRTCLDDLQSYLSSPAAGEELRAADNADESGVGDEEERAGAQASPSKKRWHKRLAEPKATARRLSKRQYGGDGSGAGGGERTMAEEELREMVEELADKLRAEKNERSRLVDELARRGIQLSAISQKLEAQEERMSRQGKQLHATRMLTLKLERELKVAREEAAKSEEDAVVERKKRYQIEVRMERTTKAMQPVAKEVERRGETLRVCQEALLRAEEKEAEARELADRLTEENASLKRRVETARPPARRSRWSPPWRCRKTRPRRCARRKTRWRDAGTRCPRQIARRRKLWHLCQRATGRRLRRWRRVGRRRRRRRRPRTKRRQPRRALRMRRRGRGIWRRRCAS